MKASGVVSKVFAALLLVAPGAGVCLLVATDPAYRNLAFVGLAWVLVYLTVAVLATVDAAKLFRRGDPDALGACALLVKYCSIPFFVANFFALVAGTAGMLLLSSMFAAGGVTATLAVFAAPLLVLGTYLIMLPTSVYGIAGALLLRRHGRASTSFVVVMVILHLMFVVDIFATLAVAYRAKPGPARPTRMVRWVAGVVVMALLVPTGLFIFTARGNHEQQRVTQQSHDAMSALPGVSQVNGMTVDLVPGISYAQARAIAVEGYTSQDGDSPVQPSRWTLVNGSAKLVLRGDQVQDAAVHTLVLLGPVTLADPFRLDIASSNSSDPAAPTTIVTIEQLSSYFDGAIYVDAVTKVVGVLAVADPQDAAVVGSVQTIRWSVRGDRLRSAGATADLKALGAMLSDEVTLSSLVLEPKSSQVTLSVADDDEIASTCRRGHSTLAD